MRTKGLHVIQELLLDGRIIDRAMRGAVKDALLRHERAGVPVAIWRSGEVVRTKPTAIKISRSGSRGNQAAHSSPSGKGPRATRKPTS